MSLESACRTQEIPNPHNYGEYIFVPWVIEIASGDVRALNPNGQLKLGMRCYNDGETNVYGELSFHGEDEIAGEEDQLVLKSITEACVAALDLIKAS